jgi:hypothetical protein
MKMNMQVIIEDLRKLSSGVLSCGDFRQRMKAYPIELQDLIANIDHFLSDEDIRQKEPDYKIMQEKELRKLILLLEQNATESEVSKISFLAPS